MAEQIVIETLSGCLQENEPVALVSIIGSSGSSPGKKGAIMLVKSDGEICGTVGGGNLEHTAITEALSCIESGKSRELRYTLNANGELGMTCGGEVRLFIKVFGSQPKLVVVGGGHIGLELYKIGVHQGFQTVIFDNRPELTTEHRFPGAQLFVSVDIPAALMEYSLTSDCYVAIATSSHETDRLSLEAVAESDAAYIGMVGSIKKIAGTLNYLLSKGVSREKIDRLYTPMGLNIASIQPKEIALSIMSEILLVKNNGSPEHMRRVKRIKY